MSLRSLEYAVIESVVSIRRNGLMSIASVTTVSLSLAILGGFVLMVLWLNSVASVLSHEFQMSVYMKPAATAEQIAQVAYEIKNLPHVSSVEHTPANEVWERAKRDYAGYLDLRGVDNVSLGDEFRMKLSNPRHTARTTETLRALEGIDEVVTARKEAEQIVRFTSLVKMIGVSASAILLIVTAFIISNAIRLTVFARRREIKIMQLVGASNWFIRLPLMFEGTVLGAIGGAISCGLIMAGAWYITRTVTKVMPLLSQYPNNLDPLPFLGTLIMLGCLIGAVGSSISIRRFLKA